MKTIPILPGIALHELRTADAADIFAAIDGERAYLGRWLPFVQFTRNEEDSLRFVRFRPRRCLSAKSQRGTLFLCLIFTPVNLCEDTKSIVESDLVFRFCPAM